MINIGCGQQCTTEGGIGTSFVLTTDVTAYAELGNNGGIDVWARKTRAFSSESELVYCASDLTAMSDIKNALREEEIYPQCHKNQELLEMLDSIWSSPIHSPEKQTYIPKPTSRPCGYRELVCTMDEFEGDEQRFAICAQAWGIKAISAWQQARARFYPSTQGPRLGSGDPPWDPRNRTCAQAWGNKAISAWQRTHARFSPSTRDPRLGPGDPPWDPRNRTCAQA